jgi:hypothetical protein
MWAMQVFEKQIKPKLHYFEECWIFTGSTKNGTHGNVKVGGRRGKTLYTHRIAYEAFLGEIPSGLVVMHLCNTPRCCNPKHLRVGTQADNMQYAYATGAVGRTTFTGGVTGLRGVFPSYIKQYLYWVAKANGGLKLYHGKDFFEACCRRKSWEALQ